jgi:hypothetical protein
MRLTEANGFVGSNAAQVGSAIGRTAGRVCGIQAGR